jgi:hypothetical protein
MATRRYHKKRVGRKSRKMHGGKIDKAVLRTKIYDIFTTLNGATRTKDNVIVYTISTTENSITWNFNQSNVASVAKGIAKLGSVFGATRSVLEATKENITRIYNGYVDLSQITKLPNKVTLTPAKVIIDDSTEIPVGGVTGDDETNKQPVTLIDLKTAIFYFYLYLQD